MPSAQLDLSQLSLDRSAPQLRRHRRRLISRYAIPSAILLGFVVLLAVTAGRQLLPKPSVQVMPVVVKRGMVQKSGTPLFQAPGWIEPRPTPISVSALAPGVLNELLVVEGQSIGKDEPIARLVAIDAELAVKQATARLSIAQGDLDRALAEERAAQRRLEQPVHLQAALAEAQGELAKIKTELAKLPFLIETANANLEYARRSVEGKKAAGPAVPGVVLRKAESELAAADATVRELRQRKPNLKVEMESLREKVQALESQSELLIEETRALEEAQAKVQTAKARRDEASLSLQIAELTLDRTVIRAPFDGRILRLVAMPGTRVSLDSNSGHSSSTIVEMYDPNRLQVRVDVRLEDVQLVQKGQAVEIETASTEKSIRGKVLQATSKANIQKNTLEVKVEMIEPPDTVRPEMLVTATFLAPELPSATPTESESTQRIFAPSQLIQNNDNGPFVWIVTANGRAQMASITLGKGTGEGLVEVMDGLVVTDKLITTDTNDLKDGAAVVVTGENQSIGF